VISLDRGFSVEEIADRLMEESAKAREKGQAYATQTAEQAARYVA
jgi:hypothetical protein